MLHGWLARFVALGGVLLWAACGSADADKNPSEVLLRFVEAMDRSLQHEAALKDAFALLDEQAQRELRARAERASSLASRSFAPWEMFAQGRFRLRFAPLDHAELRTTVSGDRAQVHVKDEDGRSADVPLVREHGHWRVKLELPALAQSAPRAP
jgi:hypothetical protein